MTGRWRAGDRLYPVIDTGVCAARGTTPRDLAAACLDAGVRLLQLRAKEMPGRDMLALAEALVALAAPYDARVVVNDRPDIARASGAAGVHVGQDDLPPDAARLVLGEGMVGLSTHDTRQVDDARVPELDYIAVGPVYGTGTKDTGYAPRGLSLVEYAARRGTPVVAIGGITLDRAREVLAAGAASVAIISDLFAGGRVEARLRAYVDTLNG